jgi:LCP family protein required for cell wall assembly
MEDYEAFGQLREQPLRPPAPSAPPRPMKPPRAKRSHWLRNLVLLALAYVVLTVGTALQPIPVPFAGLKLSVPFPGGTPVLFGLPRDEFTVLVVGLDRRPGHDGPSRTDTVLLLRINPKSDRAAFLSIPRDSLMAIPAAGGGYSQDRINTAFVYNWSSGDRSAAPRAVMHTIEHNLGIKVDHYVVFDQYSAKDLIDALGGVTVDNSREFGQADYSDDDVNVVPQHFPKGKLQLDGYQAVAYGRIRQGSSDFDRIERQQRVGAALVKSASSPLAVLRFPGAYRAYQRTVDTDMSMRQSAGVMALLKRVPDDKLKTRSLGDAAVSCTWCAASIQLLDPVRTREIIADTFGDEAAGQLAAERLAAAGVTP